MSLFLGNEDMKKKLRTQSMILILLCRLGIKGPLYLIDKDGRATVPLSLHTGKAQDGMQ